MTEHLWWHIRLTSRTTENKRNSKNRKKRRGEQKQIKSTYQQMMIKQMQKLNYHIHLLQTSLALFFSYGTRTKVACTNVAYRKSLLSIICHGPHSTDIPFTMITFWNQWLTAGFGHIRMKFFKNNNFQFWTFIINLLLIVPLKEFFSYPLFLNKLLMIKLLLGICWFSYL